MRKLLFALVLLGVVWLSGCYISESTETRILIRDGGEPPLIEITYHNISSSEEKEEDIRKDAEQLLRDWRGDAYLIERQEEGMLVKERKLEIRDGKIYGKMTAVAQRLNDIYSFMEYNDERIMIYRGDDVYKLASTNGKIVKTPENTLIVWPKNQKELYWKEELAVDKAVFYRNIPKMVELLQKQM